MMKTWLKGIAGATAFTLAVLVLVWVAARLFATPPAQPVRTITQEACEKAGWTYFRMEGKCLAIKEIK